MERLSAVLGRAVQFVYTCWDRIVLNGYLERLQRPEYLVHFFHDVVGIPCIEPAVLEQRTNAYNTLAISATRTLRNALVRLGSGGVVKVTVGLSSVGPPPTLRMSHELATFMITGSRSTRTCPLNSDR